MNRSRSPVRSPRGKRDSSSSNLMDHTLKDLKQMAKNQGFHGYSKMRKDELVALLEGRIAPPVRSPRGRARSPVPRDTTRYSPRY